MKKDVTELKKMFFEILQNPSSAPNQTVFNEIKDLHAQEIIQPATMTFGGHSTSSVQSMPIAFGTKNSIQEEVIVEESLNIMDKEKELIIKALKKHRGKRKDASLDLGISERTLYRKLKEYNIED